MAKCLFWFLNILLKVTNFRDGYLNDAGLSDFISTYKVDEYGVSYAVVSIIWPQRSGKCTLLNSLFGTSFSELDASKGWSQTTKGIWMAKCPNIQLY